MKRPGNLLILFVLTAVPLALSQLVVYAPKLGMVIAALVSTGTAANPGGVAALAIAVLVVALIIGLLEGERAFSVTFF